MNERRYSRDEIDAIFARAATAPSAVERAGGGLTLAELQEIGREVGISPGAVSRAALALDTRDESTTRTLLGQPIAVAHVAGLGRTLTDEEWDRLVVTLRQTFHASGRVRAEGGLRQWSNGNLRVMLEPAAHGQQLRMQTMNGNARTLMLSGMAAIATSAIVAASSGLAGTFANVATGVALLGGIGIAMLAGGALRLPRWSERRREQMAGIARQLTSAPGDGQ